MNLRARIDALVHSHFLRIVIFGGVGVIVQTVVFETLSIWLGLVAPSTATLLGAEVGVLTNFVLNNRFSFAGSQPLSLQTRLLRFHAVVSGSLFIQWLSVFIVEHLTRDLLALHSAYVAGILIGFISNYIGYHLFVWKHNN